MNVAVVIPTVGRTFFVHNIVLALLAGTSRPSEVVVVDQTEPASRNRFAFAQLQKLEAEHKCQVIESTVLSLTAARNLGVQCCSAELLIFLDDDVLIPRNFVQAYEELFQNAEIDAATGMILVDERDNGTIDTSRTHPSVHNGHTMLRGGNFAIRRSVLLAVGGLDENFVGAANYEDADLAWRLDEHGYRVTWTPSPWAYHLNYPSGGGRVVNPNRDRNFAYNLFYFHLRHHPSVDAATLRKYLRWRVFNRQNLLSPWRLIPRIRDFALGYRLAKSVAAGGPRLPLRTDNSR